MDTYEIHTEMVAAGTYKYRCKKKQKPCKSKVRLSICTILSWIFLSVGVMGMVDGGGYLGPHEQVAAENRGELVKRDRGLGAGLDCHARFLKECLNLVDPRAVGRVIVRPDHGVSGSLHYQAGKMAGLVVDAPQSVMTAIVKQVATAVIV